MTTLDRVTRPSLDTVTRPSLDTVTGPQAPAVRSGGEATSPVSQRLQALPQADVERLGDAGFQAVSADCRGKVLPGFRCVPGTNHLGQVGHFWTV